MLKCSRVLKLSQLTGGSIQFKCYVFKPLFHFVTRKAKWNWFYFLSLSTDVINACQITCKLLFNTSSFFFLFIGQPSFSSRQQFMVPLNVEKHSFPLSAKAQCFILACHISVGLHYSNFCYCHRKEKTHETNVAPNNLSAGTLRIYFLPLGTHQSYASYIMPLFDVVVNSNERN